MRRVGGPLIRLHSTITDVVRQQSLSDHLHPLMFCLDSYGCGQSQYDNVPPPQSLVYADKPQILDHLEDNIHRVIADVRPQMLEKVIENWTSRLDYIRASRGSPMPEIIFTM
ncbi:hypothetical protein TNCV_1218891 [Trichonephila clavipes]|nr:hypothetical protein TNCV_1218891 [Trichonephila clavipes]